MFQSTNRLVYSMSWLRVCLQCRRHMFDPWIRMIPWRREWQHIPVFHPGELHGQRRLAGYSPWRHKELDMTEQLKKKQLIYFLEVFIEFVILFLLLFMFCFLLAV